MEPYSSLRCLIISEITDVIVSNLESKSDLTMVARTCRMLQEPALDRLWGYQPSFKHLVKVLPHDLCWTRTVKNDELEAETHIDLMRTVVKADMNRFEFYARRITHFDSPRPGEYDMVAVSEPVTLSLTFFRSLSLLYPNGGLFPNLSSLRCGPGLFIDDSFSAWQLFLSPRLEFLRLDTTRTTIVISALANIPARCTNLKHMDVSLFDHGPSLHLFAIALRSIPSLVDITMYTTEALPYEIIHALASLPALRTITLNPGVYLDTPLLDVGRDMVEFANKFALKLVNRDIASCAHILQWARFIQLEEAIFIVLEYTAVAPNWATLFHSCSRNPGSLTTPRFVDTPVGLNQAVQLPSLTTVPSLDFATFKPLLPFTNLREVTMVSTCRVALDDDAIERLSVAWPRLEFLHLISTPLLSVANSADGDGRRSLASLSSLIHLARHCRNIRHVRLLLDTSTVDELLAQNSISTVANESLICFDPFSRTATNPRRWPPFYRSFSRVSRR
ncbi:hypothetical protein C2E23DRAFT_344498 [Lenzites betulinus]|nr:hypothetical protein C2E23DRAFT_344498 [Lenzites betulinus]